MTREQRWGVLAQPPHTVTWWRNRRRERREAAARELRETREWLETLKGSHECRV